MAVDFTNSCRLARPNRQTDSHFVGRASVAAIRVPSPARLDLALPVLPSAASSPVALGGANPWTAPRVLIKWLYSREDQGLALGTSHR